MKTKILLLALTFSTSIMCAQKLAEKEVPVPVLGGFKMKYKDVKVEKWEKEGANFEAEFDLNKQEYSVLLDAAGNILETEVEIPVSELPLGVKEYVTKNYKGSKIKEASKITDASGMVTYEAEVAKEDLIFDANGIYLKTQKP
ncbi:MAG: hypothetical protein PSX36_00025 [bacterium]|nr:hypothetical protein [bacterium]